MIKFGKYKCKTCRDLYHFQWRTKNKSYVNLNSKKWVSENKEKRKETVLKYQNKNPQEYKLRVRTNYAKRVAEGRQKKYKTNPLIRREIKNRYRVKKLNVLSEKYSAKTIFEKYNWKCAYCLKSASHLDHVLPISRGGPDTEENLVAACQSCNCSKGDKTLGEWINMKLGL